MTPSFVIILFQNNARVNVARLTLQNINDLESEILQPSPGSLDLSPNVYHFTKHLDMSYAKKKGILFLGKCSKFI